MVRLAAAAALSAALPLHPRFWPSSRLSVLLAICAYRRHRAPVSIRRTALSPILSTRQIRPSLHPSQVRVYGLPIRPSFCRAALDKDELRRELGMDAALPAVLLVGGGEGMCRALGEENQLRFTTMGAVASRMLRLRTQKTVDDAMAMDREKAAPPLLSHDDDASESF